MNVVSADPLLNGVKGGLYKDRLFFFLWSFLILLISARS